MKSAESILRHKEQIKKWKSDNPDSQKVYLKTYYEKNKAALIEKNKPKMKTYYDNNKEKLKAMNNANYHFKKIVKELLAIEV